MIFRAKMFPVSWLWISLDSNPFIGVAHLVQCHAPRLRPWVLVNQRKEQVTSTQSDSSLSEPQVRASLDCRAIELLAIDARVCEAQDEFPGDHVLTSPCSFPQKKTVSRSRNALITISGLQ